MSGLGPELGRYVGRQIVALVLIAFVIGGLVIGGGGFAGWWIVNHLIVTWH